MYVGSGCTFTMLGGSITDNGAINGGGVYVSIDGIFIMRGARMFPATPVKRRAVTVIERIPPSVSDIATAIGVVTLLGMSDDVSVSSIPRALHMRNIVTRDAMLPAMVPAAIDARWCRTSFLSL